MKRRHIWMSAAGMAYGAFVCIMSYLLIQNLSSVFGLLAGVFGLDPKTESHIFAVLEQLRSSSVGSPWILTMLFGGTVGWLLSLITGRKTRIWLTAVLAALLLLPLILVAVWFSYINDVMVGNLIKSLLRWH